MIPALLLFGLAAAICLYLICDGWRGLDVEPGDTGDEEPYPD